MTKTKLSEIIVKGLLYSLLIVFLVLLMSSPFLFLKNEIDKQRASKYHIIDISGRDYYCDSYINNNGIIMLTDYEGKKVIIYKVKTIIEN